MLLVCPVRLILPMACSLTDGSNTGSIKIICDPDVRVTPTLAQ